MPLTLDNRKRQWYHGTMTKPSSFQGLRLLAARRPPNMLADVAGSIEGGGLLTLSIEWVVLTPPS